MLFKVNDLQGIKTGKITLAFRKWKKPAVKKGTLLNTALGQIKILNISEIDADDIRDQDAVAAGFDSAEELISALRSKIEGKIYRIRVDYHSPDPRIKLRAQSSLTDDELNGIKSKLQKLDKRSNQGHWTLEVLIAIQNHPKLRAQDLAAKTGKPKDWLKQNIRKLKNLGLTISHEQGYTLSPRGKVVMNQLILNKVTHTKPPGK